MAKAGNDSYSAPIIGQNLVYRLHSMPAVYFNWRLIFYSPAACFRVDPEVPNSYLESNFLSGVNEFFCNISFSNSQALTDPEISKVGDCLIIQVKRFLVFNHAVTKDITKISCTPTLTVPVTLDEDIVDHKKFNLTATINHTGNLARGHYTSYKSTSSWFHCNDAAVIPSNETAVNNATSYIFSTKMCLENMRKKGEEKYG